MTMPDERTRAVLDTRRFLETLADGDEISVGGLARTVAIGLLRHYPNNLDLDISASVLPSVWARPEPKKRKLTLC